MLASFWESKEDLGEQAVPGMRIKEF